MTILVCVYTKELNLYILKWAKMKMNDINCLGMPEIEETVSVYYYNPRKPSSMG